MPFFISLILLSVPLSYAANSISVGIFVAFCLFTYGKRYFTWDKFLMLPVLLYLLMGLSLIWSIDKQATALALSKELPLIIIPLCFMLIPGFSGTQRQRVLKYYSYGIFAFCVFYLIKAVVRFAITQKPDVFFYHELVSLDVNAIHVSVYVAVAFFYFLVKKDRNVLESVATILLFVMIFLLSSKNIIITFIFLLLIYYLFNAAISTKAQISMLTLFVLFLAMVFYMGNIKDRFMIEYDTIMTDGTVNKELSKGDAKVYNVTVRQAWTKEKFKANDYFPGTAFRVYQLRLFVDMLQDDNIFWNGYGLNASYSEITKRTIENELFLGDGNIKGYQNRNFHNQYIQNFAELGIFGLLLLIAILFINFKNALIYKDFVHISFAVLMISLFLTESFLWRQRGVTYFTIMYCVLNAGFQLKSPITDKKKQ